ncbi:hypothetical protein Plhal304r1_c065g0153061 [Plasmopara halstedii]
MTSRREKRLHKDAFGDSVDSLLPPIGARQPGGNNIFVERELQPPVTERLSSKGLKSRPNVTSGRLLPSDSLKEIFDIAPPLTMFRSAFLCKHTKTCQERRVADAVGTVHEVSRSNRYKAQNNTPSIFKPTNVIEAKVSIQRKIVYDGQPFQDKPHPLRSNEPRALDRIDAPPWTINKYASARERICDLPSFNISLEGPIKADRKYTREFIRLSMEAHRGSRCQLVKGDKRNR